MRIKQMILYLDYQNGGQYYMQISTTYFLTSVLLSKIHYFFRIASRPMWSHLGQLIFLNESRM